MEKGAYVLCLEIVKNQRTALDWLAFECDMY